MPGADRPRLFPTLQVTDACNKSCSACSRAPGAIRHHLRYADFQRYLVDLARLSHRYAVKHQFITGGEPTLWREGARDIVDLVADMRAVASVDTVTIPSNGALFEDVLAAREFVSRLSARISRRVFLGISVAKFQNNLRDGECGALDNVLAACHEPGTRILPLLLVTLGIDDDTSEALSSKYPSIPQRVTALAPLGRASTMSGTCPSLVLDVVEKSRLGSFASHFRRDAAGKLGLTETQYETTHNGEILNRLSLFNNCSKSPIADTHWHYCVPFLRNADFDLCPIGEMEPDTIDRFVASRPWLQQLREHGVIATVARNLRLLSQRTRNRAEQILRGGVPVSVAYRGCMACMMFCELGVWREIDGAFLSCGDVPHEACS